jgi:hypothetical protein
MAPRKAINDCGNERRRESRDRSYPDFSSRRIGKKFDVLYAVTQIVENGYGAVEQRATILGRLNPLAVAIEEAYTECRLQFCNRPRNCGLRRIETPCCLAHRAGLHHGHEDVQVLQLHSAADAIA